MGEGGGGGSALISFFENFLAIQVIPTKCSDFLLKFIGSEILEKNASRVSLVALATPFSTPCLAKF